uniref:2OG-Fe(II) oxygenase superfamily protein n=1 Tax=Marseillevirus LCMAC202 TaxID=2506606 RepID=A0A481YZ89_9VIRU|nr:MAG: 2OG-Fe(II) oxygenase superfamily protein [Marseillevirus LCMAC202]
MENTGEINVESRAVDANTVTTGHSKVALGQYALSTITYGYDNGIIYRESRAVDANTVTTGHHANTLDHGTIFDRISLEFNANEKINITPHVWSIPNWFSGETCELLIKNMEYWIKNETMHTFQTGKYTFYNDLQTAPKIAEQFYQVIKPYVHDVYHAANGGDWEFIGVNPIIPWAMYKAGEEFGRHQDTPVKHKEGEDKMTCLIYLNDDFEGGQTFIEDTDEYPIEPKQGTALIFDIDLWHRGHQVESGKKYWVGFEMIFKRN